MHERVRAPEQERDVARVPAPELRAVELLVLEPLAVELQVLELRAVELQVLELRAVELLAVELLVLELRAVELLVLELRALEPLVLELQVLERALEQRALEQQALELRALEPRALEQQALEQQALVLEQGVRAPPEPEQRAWALGLRALAPARVRQGQLALVQQRAALQARELQQQEVRAVALRAHPAVQRARLAARRTELLAGEHPRIPLRRPTELESMPRPKGPLWSAPRTTLPNCYPVID